MIDNIQPRALYQNTHSTAQTLKQHNKLEQQAEESGGFSFDDILDIINPLQHIPFISSFYKEQMQDEISTQAKAVGDMLYGILTGGILGGLGAVGNSILKQQTDKDLEQHLIAFMDDDGDDEDDEFLYGPSIAQQQSDHFQNKNLSQKSQNHDYWSIRMKQLYGENDHWG